jgi:hypothetical protein
MIIEDTLRENFAPRPAFEDLPSQHTVVHPKSMLIAPRKENICAVVDRKILRVLGIM